MMCLTFNNVRTIWIPVFCAIIYIWYGKPFEQYLELTFAAVLNAKLSLVYIQNGLLMNCAVCFKPKVISMCAALK